MISTKCKKCNNEIVSPDEPDTDGLCFMCHVGTFTCDCGNCIECGEIDFEELAFDVEIMKSNYHMAITLLSLDDLTFVNTDACHQSIKEWLEFLNLNQGEEQ